MEKITSLKVLDPSKPTPNEAVVRILRDALARARTGEVRGVAITLAVIDPQSQSGRGSIHLTTYEANYKDTLYMGVGAMEYSMKADTHKGVVDVDRLELKDHDESEDELAKSEPLNKSDDVSVGDERAVSMKEPEEPRANHIKEVVTTLQVADRQTIYSESTDPRLEPDYQPPTRLPRVPVLRSLPDKPPQ